MRLTANLPLLFVLAAAACWAPAGEASQPPAPDMTPDAQAPPAQEAPAGTGKTPPPPAKVRRYVERIIETYDANLDGQLQPAEWAAMRGEPSQMDANRDGTISCEEFVRFVAQFAERRRVRLVTPEPGPADSEPPLLQPIAGAQPAAAKSGGENTGDAAASTTDQSQATSTPAEEVHSSSGSPTKNTQPRRDRKFFVPASRLPQNLPAWFQARDRDGDGQITLAEYASTMTPTTFQEFLRYDVNGDGLITVQECLTREKSGRTNRTGSSSRSDSSGRPK